MGAITDILSRFGPGRLAAMGAVTLALVGFFAFVIMRVSQPAMGVLFSELSASDAGAIMRDLDTKGVRYETRDDGATILAPRAELARIRMDLAGKALPAGGGVGYEIFDKGDAFSSTSFVQGINQLRALEGELARTIRTIARVQGVRVHLAIPERRLFERDREPPRASIVLKVRGELGAEQVQAVRHLVASAVQGLAPDRVSIVDERGRLLADGTGSGQLAVVGTGSDDRRVALERRLRSQVEEIVAGIVGPGRSRVQVAAELDMNRIESRSENFDPEGRVVRSTQTRGETSTSTSGGDGQVSVGNELPGARDAAAAAQGAAPKDAANKTEEITNYEISRTTRTEVLEPGRLKRLSVAVLVDGTYAKPAGGGEAGYQPRSREDLERIAALVRTAVGFEGGRGDQVEVVNLPFAGPPAALDIEPVSLMASLLTPTREDILRFGELGIIALLTVIVLFVVVRPMVKRVIAPDGGFGRAAMALVGGREGQVALAGPDGRAPALADQNGSDNGSRALIGALNELPGAGPGGNQAEQIARIGELAAAQPKDAANLLRGWMNEP